MRTQKFGKGDGRYFPISCWPIVCFSVVSLLPGAAFGGQNGADSGTHDRVNQAANQGANRITLDVAVTDKAGRAITGLQQQEFTLLDNKTPQKILSFQAMEGRDAPAEVVVVIDEVNASFRAVSNERQQLEKFLGREGGELSSPVSLIFFTDAGAKIGTTPTRDGKVLITELHEEKAPLREINRSQGFYGAGDRFQLSLRTIGQLAEYEATKPGRKLVVWVSPGWPLLSGPQVQLTSKEQDQLFNSVVTISGALRRANITLDSIDPLGTADAGGFRTFYWEQFVKGVKSPNQVSIGNLGLQVLAAQSGGRVLNSNNDITDQLGECISDANAYYVLTFEGLPGDGPNDYHSIEVKVDRPGAVVRTRAGYYAQPEMVKPR